MTVFQLFVKCFYKSCGCVCFYFILVFQKSTLCFSSNFVTSLLNSLSHRNTFGYLKPFLYITSNTNSASLAFLILRALATLYLDATAKTVYTSFYVFSFKDIMGHIKQIKLMLLISVVYFLNH